MSGGRKKKDTRAAAKKDEADSQTVQAPEDSPRGANDAVLDKVCRKV